SCSCALFLRLHPSSTLVPYTTLFRSDQRGEDDVDAVVDGDGLETRRGDDLRCHQRRRQTTQAVQGRHQLRHGGHLDPQCDDHADHRADPQTGDHDRPVEDPRVDEGGDDRAQHAGCGDPVAGAGGAGMTELLETYDHRRGAGEVEEVDHFSPSLGLRNISSIRSVTTKPPTTLMVAATRARKPRTWA